MTPPAWGPQTLFPAGKGAAGVWNPHPGRGVGRRSCV